MNASRSFAIFQSSSAAARLDAALDFLRSYPASQPVTIVAASRGAADDLARRLAVERGATIGLARYSLAQLAARVAALVLARRGIAPASRLGSEAVAARVAFDATSAGSLDYFSVVATTPGFPRALARTIGELRAAGVEAEQLGVAGPAATDLGALLVAAERQYEDALTADRTQLLAEAVAGVADEPELRAPLLLLDLALETASESRFAAALSRHAATVFATVAAHDDTALAALQQAGGQLIEPPRDLPAEAGSYAASHTPNDLPPVASGFSRKVYANALARLRDYVFTDAAPPVDTLDDSVEFFSAPGEGREAVEVARRILGEARRGIHFDEIAILLRAPHHYHGLLEHALARAGIPAWFDRGTRRPHPAGRAFLALLACAFEGLSARRFAEYLSLGQLPSIDAPDVWEPASDELLGTPLLDRIDDDRVEQEGDSVDREATDPIAVGTLPAPRRWEKLLVDASVIGGDPARWRRRLDGLEAELLHRLAELNRSEAQSARAEAIARDVQRLQQLRAFALPLISELTGWPDAASWGDWLGRFEALAPRVLRMPAYVLRVLADLRPMSAVGPVSLGEVRSVLADRLLSVDAEPPARRYGRVFVGSPSQARGRAFKVVLVPGLAERMFPQKPRQDPLLPDTAREAVAGARLPTRTQQGVRERLLLHLAIGAATERIYLSYPRLEVVEGRARVPSFYALDVLRGATGHIPDHETLAAAAAKAGDPSLAWPAPSDPAMAIDEQEHDLAVLRLLLDAEDLAAVRGHAQYMLKLNPALKRSLTDRWARAEKKWTQYDGLTRVAGGTADALLANRLGARPYSLSALQRFAACPYQFLLSAVYRLQPAEQPSPLQRLDPLTKGSLVHAIQASFFRALDAQQALPVTPESLNRALDTLEQSIAMVGTRYEEALAPAVHRVWRDELAAIAGDLRGWVRQMAETASGWTPRYFELAFGLQDDPGRDPHSVPDPVSIDGRFVLRGSVDLIEEDGQDGLLRVTDHKTGRDRHNDAMVIGGGEVLQPVLYSLAVERILNRRVGESRLSFCTSAGGFTSRVVPLTPESRRAGLEALEVVDRAIERGTLPAAPRARACEWCDFRIVCGPHEEERIARKPKEWLADLIELRSRP